MNNRTYAPHESSIRPRPATARNEQGMGIEEITARAGVSERLVRHCEARGLILGEKEADSSGRRYTQDDVCLLRFARRAHVLGFGMNEVARLLYLWRGEHRMSSEVKSISLDRPKERTDELEAIECVLERLAKSFSLEHEPTCPILEKLMGLRGQVTLGHKRV